MPKIRVLVIDDSLLCRVLIARVLGADLEIEVVGAAPDAPSAWRLVQEKQPDVLTLDIEMPWVDGLMFLQRLMAENPKPVVVVSSLSGRGKDVSIRALELGAVDVVEKPRADKLDTYLDLARNVKAAARARPRQGRARTPRPAQPSRKALEPTERLIAIGASTGGTDALTTFLSGLPEDSPGIVIVQHMPAGFTSAFAERLDRICAIRVKEAEEGDRIVAGRALIAPGQRHLKVRRVGSELVATLSDEAHPSGHRPSVDVLFHACAKAAPATLAGVVLTGMGADGAEGLEAIHRAGGVTFAQDEASCVVFGMPREAIARGAVDHVLALDDLPSAVLWSSNG